MTENENNTRTDAGRLGQVVLLAIIGLLLVQLVREQRQARMSLANLEDITEDERAQAMRDLEREVEGE